MASASVPKASALQSHPFASFAAIRCIYDLTPAAGASIDVDPFDDTFADGIVLQFNGSALDRLKYGWGADVRARHDIGPSKGVKMTTDQIAGLYFKIGYIHGKSVFKHKDCCMYIWVDPEHGGWICSEELWTSDSPKDERRICASFDPSETGAVPCDVHIPYWDKEPAADIRIITMRTHLRRQSLEWENDLDNALAARDAMYDERDEAWSDVAQLEKHVAQLHEELDALREIAKGKGNVDADTGGADKGKGKYDANKGGADKGKGKGKGDTDTRGGNKQKIAALVNALFEGRWYDARDLAHGFYQYDTLLAWMVDEKGRKGGKGGSNARSSNA